MTFLPIAGYSSIVLTCGVLLFALLRARRTNLGLALQLSSARAQHVSHELQLSQRFELDSLKDEFISTVSHELRTPLTSIRGALGLLTAGLIGAVDPKAKNLLRIALTNTDRLIRLINDILDLERMESGRSPLQIRRCSLRELTHQAVETMTALADAAEVQLEFAPVTSAELFFDADSDRILQVLTNLLSNAIKFSPPGSSVRLHIHPSATSLLLTISDQGRGVPESKLESIFDRFQQVEAADARQKGGTGLGLAICRTIVHQHGGSIWAQPNPVSGVSLCAQFPRSHRGVEPIYPLGPDRHRDFAGTILVCDDDNDVRTIVSENLRYRGFDVLEASRGEQALDLAARYPVHAILLDLYMPGLSGWETLRLLKASPATAAIPIVILSVLSSSERPALVDKAQGWVQKPFDENLLFAELGRVLHAGDGPASVLLVEDDADLAGLVVASFQQAGIAIAHASTRQHAIHLCQTHPPDLLILDLTLSDGDGFSLVDWLRQQPSLRTLPLVVYSGREVAEAERALLRLGPTQFLTKAKVQPHEVESLVLAMVQRLRAPAPLTPAPLFPVTLTPVPLIPVTFPPARHPGRRPRVPVRETPPPSPGPSAGR